VRAALLRFLRGALFDDLVELTAVEPHAAAFRAIVDLDVLSLGHDQIDLAAGHSSPTDWLMIPSS
jgi:hypothetical protein